MEETKKLLEERKKYLLKTKKEKEKALSIAPEGTLRICSSRRTPQYYQRIAPKDTSGVYIREKDNQIIPKLAQKDYNRKVLVAVEKELKAIDKYLANYPNFNAEQIYESLHAERQKLVLPIRESDEQYVQNWVGTQYQGKEFCADTPELYTAKGERVRSKSEVIIADVLSREGVPYRYEYPIYLKGLGKVYPDFTVLNVRLRKEIYWEHLGMMDDSDYVEKAIQKIAAYEKSGFWPGDKLILTYETRTNPINQKQIRDIIEHHFQ